MNQAAALAPFTSAELSDLAFAFALSTKHQELTQWHAAVRCAQQYANEIERRATESAATEH